MQFLSRIRLIQGGMGIYVSNWRLARAVSMEKPGVTAGTVSGTALDVVYVRLLQLGDPGGHVRRAFTAFDDSFGVDIGRKIWDRFYIEGGKAPHALFKSAPMHLVRSLNGSTAFPASSASPEPIPLTLDEDIIELLIASGFAEVWLAKEGHDGKVFINFLNKVELPLIYHLYGAILAGVDGIVVGAGNPEGLPAMCTSLARHEPVTKSLSVLYRNPGEQYVLSFSPRDIAGGKLAQAPLKRPAFLAIASLEELVEELARSQSEAPDGFIIEHHSAGGHNANPLGPMRKDESGQPIYGERDNPNIEVIRRIGIPFWLGGGYGSREKLRQALHEGATGVQVGSVFALAEESGMRPEFRSNILKKIREGFDDASIVRTSTFSPTGFSFKVVQMQDTLSEAEVFENRRRICDIGLLQQRGLDLPDQNGMRDLFQRCPAGPVDNYVKRRGLARNTEEKRCLCNGLLSCVGLGQVRKSRGVIQEEPAVITLGDHLDGVRRLSRGGQTHYWAKDVIADILG